MKNKLKSFIIVSVAIHIIGGLALYFYYHPVSEQPLQKESPETKSLKAESIESPDPSPVPAIKAPIKESRKALNKQPLKKALPKPATFKKNPPTALPNKNKLSPPPAKALNKEKLSSSSPQIKKDPPQKTEEILQDSLLEGSAIPSAPSPMASQSLPPQQALEREEPLEQGAKTQAPQTQEPLQTALELAVPQEEAQEEIQETLRAKATPKADKETLVEKKDIKKWSELSPRTLSSPLEYPEFARRKGMQGELSVIFYINAEGFTEQFQLEKSSGHRELDNFVIRYVSRQEFLDRNLWARFNKKFVLEGEETEKLRLRTLEDREKAL